MQPTNHKGSCKEGPPLAPGGGGGSSVGASVIGNAVKAVIGAIIEEDTQYFARLATDIFSGSGGRGLLFKNLVFDVPIDEAQKVVVMKR